MVVAVTGSVNEAVVALEQLPGPNPPLDPPTSLTIEICGIFDNFSISHWDKFSDKSKYFDYCDFVSAREIEDNIGVDVGVWPALVGNIPIRDYGDSRNIWTELIKILRSEIRDHGLQIKGPVSTTYPFV